MTVAVDMRYKSSSDRAVREANITGKDVEPLYWKTK